MQISRTGLIHIMLVSCNLGCLRFHCCNLRILFDFHVFWLCFEGDLCDILGYLVFQGHGLFDYCMSLMRVDIKVGLLVLVCSVTLLGRLLLCGFKYISLWGWLDWVSRLKRWLMACCILIHIPERCHQVRFCSFLLFDTIRISIGRAYSLPKWP